MWCIIIKKYKNKKEVLLKYDGIYDSFNIESVYNMKMKLWIENNKYLLKPVLILFFLYFLALFPLMCANFNYLDDLGRTFSGYQEWLGYSRYVSEFFSIFIHTGRYMTDISPLPQCIAILLLSLAGVIVILAFQKTKKVSFWNIVAVIPIGLCPYFLECLSYKYDAPYMAFSILVSVIPILFIKNKKSIFSIITIICTILMCTSYQASSGIFPMILLFYMYDKWNQKEKIDLKQCLIGGVSFLVGLLLFKIFLMKQVSNPVSSEMFSLLEFVPGIFHNIMTYYQTLLKDFKDIWLILILFVVFSYVYLMLRDGKQKIFLNMISIFVLLFINSLMVYGIYSLLKNPLFVPRSMFGIGAFLTFIMIQISNCKKSMIENLGCFLLSWCFFVFTFQYGNALSEQKRYTDFRIHLVIEDLNELDIMNTNEIKSLKLVGSIGKSPVLRNLPQDYQMLNKLVPDTFGGEWIWSESYFYHYFDLKNINPVDDMSENYPILKNTMYHTIKGDKNHILIELK